MKPISEKALPNGSRRVTIELAPGESILPLRANAHYRLGDPLNEVVHADMIEGAVEVTWCSVEQAWVS